MIRKTFLLMLLTLLLATPALAEKDSTLYGVVSDNGAPLMGTVITIIGTASYTSASTTTDENGAYSLGKLPRDEYIVRAIPQPAGIYKDGAANVFLGEGKKKEVNFSMEKK